MTSHEHEGRRTVTKRSIRAVRHEEERYRADDIDSLEYPVSIWKRPSMYLGDRGSQQSVGIRELTDNATQEGLRGYADHVRVIFSSDGSIIVQDNGRGLPVDVNRKTGKNGIVLTMATLHAGANFKSSIKAGQAGAGLNGVGASVTNALSKRFDVTVYRGGHEYSLSFRDGYPGHFQGDGPDAAFMPGTGIASRVDPRSKAEKTGWETGTRIRTWYNQERFPPDESVDRDDMIDRLHDTAYIIPGLTIDVTDEVRTNEDGTPYEWSFHSDGGIPELCANISPDDLLADADVKGGDEYERKGVHHLHVEGHYDEATTDENAHPVTAKRTVTADLAMRWGVGHEKMLKSYVNTIHTHLGGVHEEALDAALLTAFTRKMKSTRVTTAKDEPVIADDLYDGATIILSVNVPEPSFRGQQKDRLSGPEVKKALTAALTRGISTLVDDSAQAPSLKIVYEKVRDAANDRKAAVDAKLLKRQSHKTSSASLPSKLSDCEMTDTPESELLICEGDSAQGTIEKARDATFQAVLPVRGKGLNSLKADTQKILANREINDIAKALGAGMGDAFDIEKCRYGRVIFAADADVDGLHINNLLYTIFNRLFRPLIKAGRVYQAVPPLFEIRVGSGKSQRTLYAIDEDAKESITKRLDAQGKRYKVDRDKGLGEMEPDDFYNTVLDPEHRVLRRIVVTNEDAEKDALDLTMNDSSPEKKKFMGDNFSVAVAGGLVEGY